MLGTLRLVLAAVVVCSHAGGNLGPLWIGVTAVSTFFMISGYAMTALVTTRFDGAGGARLFFLERIVRLAPQYYFWLALALIQAFVFRWSTLNTAGFLPFGLCAYLAVIPLGLQRFVGPVNTLVLPQATSLGIELTFYALTPWMVRTSGRLWAAAATSLAIFLATALGVLPENLYTYFNSPGPLVFFVIGSFLYRQEWRSLTLVTVVLMAVLLYGLPQRFNAEFLAGLAIGLPLLVVLTRLPAGRWDSILGDASYGCFLGHGVVIAAIGHYLGATQESAALRGLAILGSCVLGYMSYRIVEAPTIAFRRNLRRATAAAAH